MNSKRLLCFLLGAALILQTPATAYAAETGGELCTGQLVQR